MFEDFRSACSGPLAFVFTFGLGLSGCGSDGSTPGSQPDGGQAESGTGTPAEPRVVRSAELTYETSDVEQVATAMDRGRELEAYANPAYPCGLPDQAGGGNVGSHEFMIVRPQNYDPASAEPITLFLTPAGNNLGWIDDAGEYKGIPGVATATWNRQKLAEYATHTDPTLINEVRRRHPDWTLVFTSACSHDASNGEGENPDYPRYGWLALVSALQWIHERTPIATLYASGASAGASAALYVARDLEHIMPGVDVRGLVFDSQGQQPAAFAALFEEGPRRTVTTGYGDATTEVGCTLNWSPVMVGLERAGLVRNAADEIADGLLDAPIFHVWNRRDRQFCNDEDYSNRLLHGPIARAIVEHNPHGRSVNREVCIDFGDSPEVRCDKHGTLYECFDGCVDQQADPGEPSPVQAAADWIDALHSRWDEAETDPSLR